jgi:lysophospholipase L1-like esterase
VPVINARLRDEIPAMGATLVDVAAIWRAEWMGADGLHPTVAGYRAIGEAFAGAIR